MVKLLQGSGACLLSLQSGGACIGPPAGREAGRASSRWKSGKGELVSDKICRLLDLLSCAPMLVRFSCHAELPIGQHLSISSDSHPALNGLVLRWGPDHRWEGECDLNVGEEIHYKYNHEGNLPDRVFTINSHNNGELLVFYDELNSRPETFAVTSAFRRVFFPELGHRPAMDLVPTPNREEVGSTLIHFDLNCWRIARGQHIRICGGIPQLGNWEPSKSTSSMSVAVYPSQLPFEYKFVLVTDSSDASGSGSTMVWESGPNRRFDCDAVRRQPVAAVRVDAGVFHWPAHVRPWRAAGAAVPVFSLRSDTSCGTGEFPDISKFARFCKACGMKIVQILPVNETATSYPYSCLSVFALHPMYINLDQVLEDESMVAHSRLAELQEQLARKRKELEALEELEFDSVLEFKLKFLGELHAHRTGGPSEAETQFVRENAGWLPGYVRFRGLAPGFVEFCQYHAHRQLSGASRECEALGVCLKGDLPIGVSRDSCDVWEHPELFHVETCSGAPPDYFSKIGQNWDFPTYNWPEHVATGYAWWRSRFHALARYFHAIRIDHVLGIFRIWTIPRGDVTGMRGRFVPSIPIYKAQLEAAGIWDVERLITPEFEEWEVPPQYVSMYFEVCKSGKLRFKPEYTQESQVPPELYEYMSDVILLPAMDEKQTDVFWPRFDFQNTRCFSKLPWEWQRTLDEMRKQHFFGSAQNELWRDTGMRRLQMLVNASDMLLCAEDLGLIPDCVPEVLSKLDILCLKIQRMPRETWVEFDHPHTYPYLCVCSPSTHDMSTVRGWWEEDRPRTQRFYETVMGCTGPAPLFAEPWVVRRILSGLLHSNAMLAVFPIQDWLGCNGSVRRENPFVEQINFPSNPRHRWSMRLHLTVEAMLHNYEFIEELKSLISESGRS